MKTRSVLGMLLHRATRLAERKIELAMNPVGSGICLTSSGLDNLILQSQARKTFSSLQQNGVIIANLRLLVTC